MDFYSMTDKAIEAELGLRFKSLRLRKNYTQQQLADAVTLSLNSIKALEAGRGKISTVIAVLRELGGLAHLDSFISEITISPMQLATRQRKMRQRQRASGMRGKPSQRDEAQW